jgi:uncharacterized protein
MAINLNVMRHRRSSESKDNALKISVSAAPEKGKANQALIAFLSKMLKIPRQNINVINGQTSPIKTLQLTNIEIEACKNILQNETKRV